MKASKVMKKYTGREASTIHRYAGVYDEDSDSAIEIHDDIIIIDESSMCDASILSKFFKSLKNKNARILFVGDDFQLPSVGVGNFLYDMINSGVVNISKLTKVFRQAEGGMRSVSDDVRKGVKFLNNHEEGRKVLGKDCVFWLVDQGFMLDGVISNYRKVIKKYSQEDVVILTPTNKGTLGTANINKRIQEIVNPHSPSKKEHKVGRKDNPTIFRVGDQVMNLVNSYDVETIDGGLADIFNGDSGVIIDIDDIEKVFIVDYEGVKVKVKFGVSLTTMSHSWCTTIHKCVTDDTWIYTNKGLKQIKDLNNGAKVGEFKDIEDDIMVYNGEYLEKPKSFYNDGVSETIKIKTKRNFNLNATGTHGVDVMCEDGYIRRKNAEDLEVGDYMVVSLGQEVFGDNYSIPEEILKRESYDVRTVLYDRPKKITKELGRFLGYMVADGTIRDNVIKMSKRHEDVVKDFVDLCENLFGYKGKYKFRDSGDFMCEIASIDIAGFCKKIDGIQPNNKFVPELIMSSGKEIQAEFLKAIFEDGSVNVKNEKFDHIEMSSSDKVLIDQVRMMLLNFGIVSTYYVRSRTRSGKTFTGHHLYIYKKDAQIFEREIGFVSEFKKERLALSRGEIRIGEGIPYLAKIVKELVEENNIPRKSLKVSSDVFNKERLSMITLGKIIQKLDGFKVGDKRLEYLRDVYNNKYLDKIVSLDSDYQHTYCLEMPETNKFVQNGLHAYNSQGSQFKVVIVLIDKSATYQLNANLMYTGFSRGESYMLVLGQADVINRAMTKFANMDRRSFLKEMLIEEYNKQ